MVGVGACDADVVLVLGVACADLSSSKLGWDGWRWWKLWLDWFGFLPPLAELLLFVDNKRCVGSFIKSICDNLIIFWTCNIFC